MRPIALYLLSAHPLCSLLSCRSFSEVFWTPLYVLCSAAVTRWLDLGLQPTLSPSNAAPGDRGGLSIALSLQWPRCHHTSHYSVISSKRSLSTSFFLCLSACGALGHHQGLNPGLAASEVNLHLGNAHILSIFVLNTALSFKETEAMRKNTESHLASTQRGPGEPESVPPTFAFQTAPSSSCPPLFLPGLDECPPLFLPGLDESGTFYVCPDFNCDYTPRVSVGPPDGGCGGLRV